MGPECNVIIESEESGSNEESELAIPKSALRGQSVQAASAVIKEVIYNTVYV